MHVRGEDPWADLWSYSNPIFLDVPRTSAGCASLTRTLFGCPLVTSMFSPKEQPACYREPCGDGGGCHCRPPDAGHQQQHQRDGCSKHLAHAQPEAQRRAVRGLRRHGSGHTA